MGARVSLPRRSKETVYIAGRGTARAEDAQGTPTQSHVSPSILVYEDTVLAFHCTYLSPIPVRTGTYRVTSLIRKRPPPLGPP